MRRVIILKPEPASASNLDGVTEARLALIIETSVYGAAGAIAAVSPIAGTGGAIFATRGARLLRIVAPTGEASADSSLVSPDAGKHLNLLAE